MFSRKYHGAEHKAIQTYKEKQEITIENIKRTSRINENCGTQVLVYLTLLLLVLMPITHSSSLSFFLGLPLAMELRYTKGFKWINKIGFFFQKYTTAEPTIKELELAKQGIKKLLELENS